MRLILEVALPNQGHLRASKHVIALGACADHLIVPVTPDPKGLVGAVSVVGFHRTLRKYAPHLKLTLFVPTLVDKRFQVQKEGLSRTFEYLTEYAPVAPPLMNRKSLYDGAWVAKQPSALYAPQHAGVKELSAVVDHLFALIGVSIHVARQ